MSEVQTAAKIEIVPKIHGHRCENCFRNGVTVVWVHDDTHAGTEDCVKVASGHSCPNCGGREWKKWLIPAGKLPVQQQFVHFVSLEQIKEKFVYTNLQDVNNTLILIVEILVAAFLMYRLYMYYKGNGKSE